MSVEAPYANTQETHVQPPTTTTPSPKLRLTTPVKTNIANCGQTDNGGLC